MKAFLQSLNENVSLAVEARWTQPTNSPASWDDDKIKTANFNNRALNSFFSAMTNEKFKKISSTECK